MMLLLGVLLVGFHLASSTSQFPLARRNVFRRQMTDCSSSSAIFSTLCTPQYGQPFVNDVAECGLHALVQSFVQFCSSDSNGQSCFEIDDTSKDNAEEQCSSPRDLQNCTSGCRDAILAYRRDFGCCVNADIDSDQLWSSCGVEKPGLCEGSILEIPEVNAEQVCSEEEGEIMFSKNLVCGGEGGHEILENFATCFGRIGTDLYLYQLCGKDENGLICYEAEVSDEIDDDIDEAIDVCFLNPGSIACCSALQEVKSDYGCCSYNEIDDEIWSACGLEAPELCNATVLIIGTPTTVTMETTTVTMETPTVTVETPSVTVHNTTSADNTTAVDNTTTMDMDMNAATNNVPFVLVLPILAVFAFMMV